MIIPPTRNDSMGLGHFGSKRGDRLHRGHDLAVYPDSLVCTKSDCVVEKINRAYKSERMKEYMIVSLRIDEDTLLRLYYVEPMVKVGSILGKDDIVGKVQNISKSYRQQMINHLHVGLKINDTYVDPYSWLIENGWIEEIR